MYSDLSTYLDERFLQTTQDMIAILSVSEHCGNANKDLENYIPLTSNVNWIET